MNKFGVKLQVRFLVVLFGLLLLGVTNVYGSGSAYSRARAYLRSDAPSGSGKVYVGQAATSSPNYQTSSTSEKQGEKTTTTYHFYAQAATGYKFTGWYSKNANDEYVAAPNSTVSSTTYTYTDAHYVVNVTSGSNPSSGSSYTDKDLYAGFIKVVQMSFIRPEDGSFTITHNGAAVADYASFTVDGKVVLTATPDAGYKLRGWYTTTDGGVTKNYFAFSEVVEPSLTSNVTIGAEFVLDDGKADFWVKGTTTTYNNLNDANTAAAATSAKTIVLVNSGTIPAGTYTISSGVTLLIPYGSDYSKTDQPNIVHVTSIGAAPALSVYKKLSLAAGATINCSGKICVGGQVMSINGGNPTSVVRGRAGVIDLSRGGLINLNSGSALYAWGFVQGQDIDQGNNTSGMGTIDAKSGSTVWEVFQCGEWRGGTASSTIYSNRSSWKFFPFQSYTVQNIEAPITYRAGATGKCKWTIFGDGKIYTVDFTLIGSSNALFNMSSGATLNKRYDATTDRICYELNGTNAVNALSLSAMGETINSSEYRLPIPANMQITVTGGTTSISNQMVLHAGAYVDIRSGATLNINTNVYIFDQTDWDTYCMYKYYYRSYKSLTKHYDRGEGTSKATLEDATVIVDGNLTFGGSGRLYSTTNGANIRGNNGGRITFGTLPTQTTIVMCKELKDNVSVNVSSANMHNIDGSYTKSVASTTFHNVNGRWFAAADKDPKADHTYKFTYIKSGAVYGTGGTNATINTIYRSGWIDVKADVCDDWWDGLADTYLYNYTFNNAWHQYENTSTVIGEGDEAATIYSGTDNNLYAKTECNWEEYAGADENCLQTMGGVKKAFINGSFVALTKNTEDEAYHNSTNATEYYICFKDGCEWYAATKVAGANKAYTVTATGQKYIWYNGAWLAATQESPYFYTRSESGEKTYYEYVGSEWTEANVVAESTRNGVMTRYFNLPDAFTDANDNTKPGESTTIKIMKNVTITSALTYRPVDVKGGTCTIDLNGFTLSGSIDNMITINHDKAVLVVLDQSPEETGKISISYSANNTRRRAIYVQNGRLMLNSGTIQATNSQAQVDAIYVNTNELCDINGGQVKATATSSAYGIHTAGGTARCTIKGGTITATSPASKGVYSEGGEIRMSAGTVNATTTGTEAMGLATTNTATSTITLSGGTVTASADSTAYGVQSGTASHNGTATISGGIIRAAATKSIAYGVHTYGPTTITGGKIYANAGAQKAYGICCYAKTTTINTNDSIHANATARYAYGVYTGSGAVLQVNSGVFDVNTPRDAYGLYMNKGTATINNGEFLVTATGSSRHAYGMYLVKTNPKVVVNGGKFKVTAPNAHINVIATDGLDTQMTLAGGYYSKEPHVSAELASGSCIASGKEVKDLDAVVEASLISAGYTKKIAGQEYTVTWCTMRGNTGSNILKTEKVESGKVPVWTGAAPNLSDANTTREWYGWTTETWNSGTKYGLADALPAITDHDVTYYARYQNIYAEVTANGTTTRYNSAQTAWTQALKNTQATIRLLSNLGTEASISNMTQLVFNPTNANSIITLDLNGHSWTMGNHATASENKDVFLNVSPSKANCKLIVTDNSASGNGYLMNKQAYSANLLCANVTAGELLLQGGGLKVNNTHATCNAVGVQANGGVFNMVGGLVESKKEADAVTGGMASGVYAYSATNISGGTIRATNVKSSAAGVYVFRNTFTTTLSDDVHVITNGSQSYAVYGYGSVEVSGGTYDVTAEKVSPATWTTARGVFMIQNSSTYFGKATIKGNPVFNVTGVSGAAYGVYSYNHANVESVVEGGTFNVTTTGAGSSIGVTAQDQATTTVKGGTFNVSIPNAAYEQCFGAYAQTNGIVNIEGGTFTVSPTYVGGNNDCARISGGDDTQLNISGGTFTSTNCAYGVRCFNGTTRISGNPVFSARYGIDVATWANLSGNHTATVIVDGGTFIATTGSAIRSNKNERVVSEVAYNVYGDMTVWDGKFYSGSNQPIDASSGTSYLKIRGGYYSTYTSSNVSNLNKYVVSPSTTEAYATTIDGKAYTYRVNTKYNVTWSVNGVNTVQEYNRNETPNYGSTPTISDGNTYEFLGWNTAVDGSGDTIASVTTDVTYYAVFRKYEAEVIEGESATGTKFEHFADAFNLAKNMPIAKIKILSDVYYGTGMTLNPDSASGSRPLTIDLNNHIVNYTKTDNSFALTINKAGCKLIIDDSSVAKGGQFGHRQTANNGATISAIYIQNGELELAGGTIIAQNNNKDASTDNSKGTRAVVGNTGTVFTMTGGKLYAKSRFDARAFNSDGNCTFNATGGTIEATNEYTDGGTKWGNNAYGVVLWNYGTFNMSGTASMSVTSATGALGVYPYGGGGSGYPVANISGGSINCLTKTGGGARPINLYGSHSKATISGGDITANGPAGQWNIECVYCDANATADITGGNFHSTDGGGYCTGVRVFAGTVNISGNPYFDSRHGVVVGDYATTTADATAYVNGGTFNCPQYVFYATSNTRDGVGTVTGRIYVNGGYFKTASGNNICYTGSGTSNLILNGGYYNETSGTTQKSNITTYKGATTEVSILSPAITVSGTTYHYQLLTDFDITWLGGDSYSKVTTLKSGTTPTNTDLDGKCFLRNDSAFYFTGWSPTPSTVVGNTTYNAVGDYYEAEVKIGSGAWTRYTDFLEAWDVVQENANCSIRLLSNFTLADKILYKPTVANAHTVFDLNNFTMTIGGTSTSGIDFNKADAVLTITDGSSAKGGKISMTRNTTSSTYTIYIYNGELKMAGGKIYVQNNQDKVNSSSWWPAIAVYVSTGANAKLTMTGGTVESQAAYLAYTLYNYGTTNISGGTVRANATATGNSLGIYAVNGTATISGGTFNITASSTAVAATATGFINNTGSICNNGTLNITGGTFNVSATNQSAWALSTNGAGKTISGTVYKAHGVINVSGGTFNVSCPAATATQVFAVQCNGWRLFDEATPHAMLAEELSEVNISGGTFTVDTRNSGAWLDNGGNVDLLRCWGSLNVSGGTFTIYQYKTPNAIQVYRGKATVSGNPVFNVYSHTANARGVTAAGWTHNDYCDKDATKNLAEAEINGGTFKIITEGANTEGIYANGTTSAGGYAMNAKITVNGGTFLTICPNASGHYPIMLSSAADIAGTYGTAKSEIYVNGGRFKSRKGTEADNTSTGAVNAHNATGKIWLAGGYYETNAQLNDRVADTCLVTTLTSAEMDPEYANGYRYRIDVHYVAQVTAAGVDRKFPTFRGAFDYAKTVPNSKITLLDNINYEGLNFRYDPATATTCTLDLNGYTFTGAVSGHTGDAAYNNDRLLIISKAGATFTIKDSSVGKTGKFSHEKSGAGYAAIVYHGTLNVESGTVHCKNTSGSAQALRSTDPDANITMTGGKAHAEATTTAYGLNSYNTATVSGGLILAESSAGEAWGVNAQDAKGNISIQGNAVVKANAYTTAIGLRAAGGGQVTIKENACDTAISSTVGARGAYTDNGQIFVQGNAKIVADAQTIAYGVYLYSANATATIAGGTVTPKTHSVGDYASISVYPNSGASVTIKGGTFYAQTTGGTSNVSPTRTGINSTLTIDGGTFDCAAAQAVNIRGGLTTINGGTFTAATGIRAMDWADATITGTCVVNGGTFTTTGVTIYVSSKNNNSRNAHSDVLINGGKFKSTGTKIVQMDATPDGATASTLKIAGGYFNEKSGTTFKEQIEPYIADTCEINTLDPLYEGIYKYEVAPHYVASVKVNSTTTNYTILKNALDYARTQAASLVTILDDCDFETDGQYGYGLGTTGKTMTIDLNNHTVNATNSVTSYDRVFAVTGQITVTDNSVAKGGKLNLTKNHKGTFLGVVFNDASQLTLANGTIYVENETASKAVEALNIWGTTGTFRQTGGTLQAKAISATATGVQMRGTAQISGGNITVTSEGGNARAFSQDADAGNSKYSSLTVSGTPTITVSGAGEVSGVYSNVANTSATISGGTWNITSTSTSAYGVRLTKANTATISGGTFNATATTTNAYGVYVSAGGSATVSGGTFTSRIGANKNECFGAFATGTGTTLDITGGTFDANSADNAGGNINVVRVQPGATVTISGGTFRSGANSGYGLVSFGGVTTVSGTALFEAQTGAYVGSWYSGDGSSNVTATVNLNGGTFNVTGVAINATWNTKYENKVYLDSPFVNSIVNVNGGRYKTTGGTIVSKKADGADGGTATLNIAGGYFNEKSGTAFKDQINTYKAEGKAIMDLDTEDAEYAAGYRYVVTADPVAKVKIGSAVTYHTTVASAFTAANAATSASTITMLKDASVTSQLRLGNADGRNCTLNLNGHTITSTSSEQYPLIVRTSGGSLTITDLTESKLGRLDITTNYTGTAKDKNPYGVYVYTGNLNLDAGTISVSCSTDTIYGIVVKASQTFTMNGGTLDVSATNMVGYGVNSSGTATIKNGTVQVAAKGRAYGIARSGGTFTVENGKFNISSTSATAYATNLSAANANMIIQGGWYTTNNRLATGVAAPYQVLSLAGQSPYLYEVAEAYTLTWTTDGDALTGTYTSGITKVGTSIVAPNTPTKTGYTFSAWTPAVAATMPAANTTYTATWTRDNYTISYDLAGGSVASPNPTSYNVESSAITLNNPTKTNYVFAGWTGTGLAEPTTTVTIPAGSTGNRSYTATWTPAVASVQKGAASPTYHTTLADAFATASSTAKNATVTITVLQNISGITEQINYAPTNVCTTTLDLNGYKVEGSVTSENARLISFGKQGAVLEITDSRTGGELHNEAEFNSTLLCVYVNYGHLKISGGTISVKNTSTGSSQYAYAVQTRSNASTSNVQLTMTSGTVKAEGAYRVYALYPQCESNISGGRIEANATGTGYAVGIFANPKSGSTATIGGSVEVSVESGKDYAEAIRAYGTVDVQGGTFEATSVATYAYGIRTYTGTTTVTNNPSFTIRAKQYAIGVQAGERPSTSGGLYNGTAVIRGGTFDVSTTTPAKSSYTKAYGVLAYAHTRQGKTGYEGNYASAGTVDVYDGTFEVNGYSAVYGIYSMGTVTLATEPYESASATAKMNIYGGKFKVLGTSGKAAIVATSATITNTDVVVQGGWYNISTNLDQYTAPTKDCNYYVQPLADATYKWQVSEVANTGFYADIVDVDNTNSKLILNVTGWAANGWPYTINGVAYEKTAREADRTLKIPYVGEPGDHFAIKVQKSDETTVSHRTYIVPKEVTANASLAQNRDRNTYVNDGATLTVTANVTTKNIYVAPGAKLVINSGKTLTADTIFLRTTAAEAAELENNGTIAGTTKVVYTRIIKDKDFHLFGLPLSCPVSSVHLSDGVTPMYTTGWVLRSYDEERRSNYGADDNNWTTLAADGTIAGGKGYEMFSASAYYREFYFPVNLDELDNKVAVTYHLGTQGDKQAGWNAITSPFTHTYANAKVPEGLVVNWYQDGYGYYEQEIPSSIPPAYPFAIQATQNGYISFEGASIAALMPRRRAAAEEEQQIQWINLDITDQNGIGDQTSIYSHPTRYDAAYQTGIDVAKRSLTASRAIIYSSHAYGDMAFAGVADSLLEQGVALTVYSPSEQELVISMRENDWLDRLEHVWLIDHKTGLRADLLWSDYALRVPAGTTAGRLYIEGQFRAPQVTTDIQNGEMMNDEMVKARKVIINDKIYILVNGRMYDSTGKLVITER